MRIATRLTSFYYGGLALQMSDGMARSARISAGLLGTLLAGVVTLSTAAGSADPFPRYPSLSPVVAFWTGVFGRQSENTSVIHVSSAPQIVLARLDFEASMPAAKRREQERAAIVQMQRRLEQLHDDVVSKKSLDAEAKALLARFGTTVSPKMLTAAANDLRTQRGVRERTAHAMEVSGHFLPMMEATFERHSLPVALTRLPFIESSFNIEAYSKVGAAGLWQFMPATARHYMRLDEEVDDRRDPWVATDGAARHLSDDYALLKDWPLAITAYNHGRNGIRRGLEQTGGKNLLDLIDRYDNPRFGFASRNFYAEFLAAKDIENAAETFFPDVRRAEPLAFVEVTLAHYVPYADLVKLGGDDPKLFQKLNPGYSPEVRAGRLWVPRGATIRIPDRNPERFQTAYARLPAGARNNAQRVYWREHKVTSGNVLGQIARRYGVTSRSIQQANNLANANRLRVGQTLRIPPVSGETLQTQTAAAPVQSQFHVVKAGQTLSGIAQLHSVSARQIANANQLANANTLRAGQRLRIPSASGKVSVKPQSTIHVVKRGQTLSGIARLHGVTTRQIADTNQLANANSLRLGQRLRIPQG
jgi:membrane-bound lytic murein transglycosylase D